MLIHLLQTRPGDAFLWMAVAVFELLALAAYYLGRLRRQRAFALYLHFAAAGTVLLSFLPTGEHLRIYTWISFPWGLVQVCIMIAVVAELYGNTIGPANILPSILVRNFVFTLAGAAGLSVATSLIFRPQYGTISIRLIAGIEEIIVIGLAMSLVILLYQARKLSHAFLEQDARIGAGLVLMLVPDAISNIVISFANPTTSWPAQRISQIAGILSFAWWGTALLFPAAEVPAPTDEQLTEAIETNQEACHRLAVIEAALGQVVE